jgi:hypothetical protein
MSLHRVPQRGLFLALALGLLLLVGQALGQGAKGAAKPSRLYVLLVIDDLDPGVGKSALRDRDNLRRLLESGFKDHKDRLQLTVLQGAAATDKAVFDYYQNLKPEPDDTLMFYFSGHGLHDPRLLGHLLSLPGGGRMYRAVIRQVMRSKGTRLCVLLSDACASFPFAMEVRPAKEGPDWKTMRSLFFAPRGLVDLNAVTEGEVAWCNAELGGFFTFALTEALRKPFKQLDADGDGFLHWHEVIPELQLGSQKVYKDLRERALSGKVRLAPADLDRVKAQGYQSVRIFSLPPLWHFGARVLENKGEGVKVAVVHADTPAAVAGLKSGDVILQIGKTALKSADDFARAVSAARGMVEVEVQRIGSSAVETLRIHVAPWPPAGKDG